MVPWFHKAYLDFVLTSSGSDIKEEESDDEWRGCVYLLLSKLRPGLKSIITIALFSSFVHFNKRNSSAQENNQPTHPLSRLPKSVSVLQASYAVL